MRLGNFGQSGRAADKEPFRWLPAVGPPVFAGVVGNALVGRDACRWFGSLQPPAIQIPLPAFVSVGGIYYLLMPVVLERARITGDCVLRNRLYFVLAGNELWNGALFGLRSPRAGFISMLVFAAPVLSMQRRAALDPWATRAAGAYTAWVPLYDLPWSYQLCRLNPPDPLNSSEPTEQGRALLARPRGCSAPQDPAVPKRVSWRRSTARCRDEIRHVWRLNPRGRPTRH